MISSRFRPFGLRWEFVGRSYGFGSFGDRSGEYRGIVGRLPHGRGFLAGASMGEGMASFFDRDVYPTEEQAAEAAEALARDGAEDQTEYEEEQAAEMAEEEN